MDNYSAKSQTTKKGLLSLKHKRISYGNKGKNLNKKKLFIKLPSINQMILELILKTLMISHKS
jgi:hypothetical protein